MSVVAVSGIPYLWNLRSTMKNLMKAVDGSFEMLNFDPKKKPFKIAYLKLSERMDPARVIDAINRVFINKFVAYIPDEVPDLTVSKHQAHKSAYMISRAKAKSKQETKTALKQAGISLPAFNDNPQTVFSTTFTELMIELQSKYPGLFNLNLKVGNKLIEEIGRTVFERLKLIMDTNSDAGGQCFTLSKHYRKVHPHFGDFQLILGTLHRLQDSHGAPRTQLVESELMACVAHPYLVDNIPIDKVNSASSKYAERIKVKITSHINELDTEIQPTDSEEEIARKKVREELKKIITFVPTILKEIMSGHFNPKKMPFHRMKIYGEPFLPSKDTMTSFVRRYRAVHVVRSTRMFNLLKLNVPLAQYQALMAMDGTLLNGAKLVIRSSDMPICKMSKQLRAEIQTAFGGTFNEADTMDVDEDDEEM